MKETPYELLKDEQKKQLGKNNDAKMTLYNALPRREYERVFMCKTTKEVWHTLIITHQGNSQVKNCKIDLFIQEYEKFLISHEETIDSGFTRFNAIVTSLKSLDPDYSSKNHVRKYLRALPLKWRAKVTAIEEAKDLATLPLDELIGNLKVYEMILASDGVASKPIKEKMEVMKTKAKMKKAFFGGAWSDSEDGDKLEKDATCLMAIGSQKAQIQCIFLDGYGVLDVKTIILKCLHLSSRMRYLHGINDAIKVTLFDVNTHLETRGSNDLGGAGVKKSTFYLYKDINLRESRYHLFDLTKGREGKQRARAYGGEDKLLKLKIRKLMMHASLRVLAFRAS
ncbi:hypothetical protein Tco_1352375 [Tanacetum coccineum]